jgi:signal transduction histidine kinase
MTTELAQRIDRVLTMVLGALYVSGASWCVLALAVGSWPEFRSLPVFLATAAVAYVIGTTVLVIGWSGRTLPKSVAAALVALGSIAIALVAGSSGAHGVAVLGGLYTYVTAISFLWFRLPVAIAQLALAAVTYVAALRLAGAPGAAATWVVTVGIAVGGAGLVGALASWLRRLYLVESELAARLREADELKSTFLQAVSHELRTPLAVVRGYSETLDHHRERLEEDQVVDMLSRLRGASKRLDELLTDLLDVERLQRGDARPHREPCSIDALVTRAVTETASPTHHVEVDVVPFEANVEAAKLERIIANLVGNAVKHTPPGTRVRVRARPWPEQDGPSGLELQVADDGPGLDAALRGRLFQPFEQGAHSARAPSPGVGLGLAIVERFTHLHGGLVTTGPGIAGRGVSFDLRIPGVSAPEDIERRGPASRAGGLDTAAS